MPIDWNKKLALLLAEPPDKGLDFIHSAIAKAAIERAAGEGGEASVEWFLSASDRPPLPVWQKDGDPRVSWSSAPEVAHPLVGARQALNAFDAESAKTQAVKVVEDAIKPFKGDPKKTFLWIWRCMSDALAAKAPALGAEWHRVPADGACPDSTIWQHLTISGAIAGAGEKPAFLAIDCSSVSVGSLLATDLSELWNSAKLSSWLVFQAMLPIIEELGPDAILFPSVKRQPVVDAWLREQGVAVPESGIEGFASLPLRFIALVPAGRASELGKAAAARLREGVRAVAEQVREELVKRGWAKAKDDTWREIWNRQIENYGSVQYTSLAWAKDSTGAASILTKTQMDAFEKWARQRSEAAGMDEPGAGAFFGLWLDASWSAAEARTHTLVLGEQVEPGDKCTLCGEREVLHGKIAAKSKLGGPTQQVRAGWEEVVADKTVNGGRLRKGEMLCAVCALHRTLDLVPNGGLAQVTVPETAKANDLALVLINGDLVSRIIRGGKELKGAATLRDVMHSSMPEQLLRGRPQWKELLDVAAPCGPSRAIAVSEALTDFGVISAAEVVAAHSATVVYTRADELLVAVPQRKALALVRALRDRMRTAFVQLHNGKDQPARLANHFGPNSSLSAVVLLSAEQEKLAGLLPDARRLLQRVAKDRMDRDAVVFAIAGEVGVERVFGSKIDDINDELEVVSGALRTLGRDSVLRSLLGYEQVLATKDLDRGAADARVSIVRAVIAGCRACSCVDDVAVAKAVVSLIDRNVVAAIDPDASALDGVFVAHRLAGESL